MSSSHGVEPRVRAGGNPVHEAIVPEAIYARQSRDLGLERRSMGDEGLEPPTSCV